MSKNDDTEEKQLPPSQIKLNRLKREGQVAHSKDVPAAASVIVISGFLILAHSWIYQSASSFFDFPLTILPEHTIIVPKDRLAATLYAAADQVSNLIMAPLLLGLAAALVSAIIDGEGLLMSMKNMAFNLGKLNPAQGLKNIFSLSSLSEFLKGLVKCIVMLITGAATLLYFMNALFWAPLCGVAECALGLSASVTNTLMVIIAIILVVTAGFDIRISRALFRHEHRMTKTEAKREQKEMYGSPEVRSARHRIGAEIRSGPPSKVTPDKK
ncbi:EscU/YscU/HrcU family type III secretion system export apparatus switch protein [Rhizobium rhizoryzae]|uniref:Type III secretion protein U n=1 Tax=Rhizobium rhizoryzae TaxID=451876 RepID=A0A7W6PQP0_9HYPH|nr:EscU/YscU/HrcU family type III secretion system export apparatus switch protein [Rhizobium rhizoryzae]MBB4144385.1 type III secretion protein U [Rhizobium rhizoryzae]